MFFLIQDDLRVLPILAQVVAGHTMHEWWQWVTYCHITPLLFVIVEEDSEVPVIFVAL
jgi:hypothetical protein